VGDRSIYDLYRVSEPEALTVKCPKCHREPGEPCVYVDRSLTLKNPRTLEAAKRQELAGTPTKRPHAERGDAARKLRTYESPRPGRRSIRPEPEILKIQQAHRAWDLAEFQQLQSWLRQYGSIFKEEQWSAPAASKVIIRAVVREPGVTVNIGSPM
jgi:hypothetical protein